MALVRKGGALVVVDERPFRIRRRYVTTVHLPITERAIAIGNRASPISSRSARWPACRRHRLDAGEAVRLERKNSPTSISRLSTAGTRSSWGALVWHADRRAAAPVQRMIAPAYAGRIASSDKSYALPKIGYPTS